MSWTSTFPILALCGCTGVSKIVLDDSAGGGGDSPATDDSAPIDTSGGEGGGSEGGGSEGGGSEGSTPDTGAVLEEIPAAEEGWEHLPVLLLTVSGSIGDTTKTAGSLTVITQHDGTLTDLADAKTAYTGAIGIETHGRSTASDPKHNFRMELRDGAGDDIDYPLLGLGKDSDYVLYASYGDKTYLRNALAYSLAADIAEDTGAWQPRFVFTELFINDIYQGIYMLTERVKRDGSRIDLPRPAETSADGDLTGGYIFKFDAGSGSPFTTAMGTYVETFDPRKTELSAEQRAYVRQYWDDLEAMFAASDYAAQYPGWLDVDSFVDLVIIDELAHDIDGYRLSTYPYKQADSEGGLFYAGPVWDFDRGFGNVNYCDGWETTGWIYDDIETCGYAYNYAFWWKLILKDPAFEDKVRCRWDALREGALSDAAILDRMAEYTAQLAEAEPRDHALWGTLGVNVGYNYYVGDTWEDELDWLSDWVTDRAAWMDEELPGSCAE